MFSRNRVFSEKYRPQIKTMQCNLKKSLVLVQYDALPDLCMAIRVTSLEQLSIAEFSCGFSKAKGL